MLELLTIETMSLQSKPDRSEKPAAIQDFIGYSIFIGEDLQQRAGLPPTTGTALVFQKIKFLIISSIMFNT